MIFDSLLGYGGNWNVTASAGFTAEEQAAVKTATVVKSDYGKSVCFLMHSGVKHYIPLSTQSELTVGDSVDLSKARVLTLHRDGSDDIKRIEA